MPLIQAAIMEALAEAGEFSVVGTARTEAEAILWVKENPGTWDLAIVDLVLDQGSGLGVIQECRRTCPAGRVLVFSDYVTSGMREHCLGLGADAAISKADFKLFIEYCSKLSSDAA